MNKLLIVGGSVAALALVFGDKLKSTYNKLRASETLMFDVTRFVFKGIKGGKALFDMTVEVTNHSETALTVQDLILDIKLGNGLSAAKVNQVLNKTIEPRNRTTAKIRIETSLVKASTSLTQVLLAAFQGGSSTLFSKPVTITGTLKAEDTIIDINESVGTEFENGIKGLGMIKDELNVFRFTPRQLKILLWMDDVDGIVARLKGDEYIFFYEVDPTYWSRRFPKSYVHESVLNMVEILNGTAEKLERIKGIDYELIAEHKLTGRVSEMQNYWKSLVMLKRPRGHKRYTGMRDRNGKITLDSF